MISCATVAMLCLLFGCLLLTGHSDGSKLKSPKLNIKEKEIVIEAGQPIHLSCSSHRSHVWIFPANLNKESDRIRITNSACGGHPRTMCSSLTVHKAQPSDTGYYSCTVAMKNGNRSTSVYIFVADVNIPFVEMNTEFPKIVHVADGEELVIPCRVTSPNITVTFKRYGKHPFPVDQKNIIWNNKRGIIIPNPTFQYSDLLSCEATLNGIVHNTIYLPHKQSSKIHSVKLDVPDSIHLLSGDQLRIQCSVKTDLNARAEIEWKYPRTKFHRMAFIRRKMDATNSKVLVFYSTLIIDDVRKFDEGQYSCTAKNGPSTSSVNTTVRIHAKAFINVKPRTQGTLETFAGQKSYPILVKVRAFPEPEVIWLKDGLPALEKCTRYRDSDKYSLTIKDVSEEDAGKYTIVLKLKQWNLTKNLTLPLVVNVRPQIYENSVSVQEPVLYPLGSKQSLTCTVFGIPPPTITWHWRPCLNKNPKMRCDFPTDSSRYSLPLTVGHNSSSLGNTIHSIRERTQMIEGKNKTAGTISIDNSRVSGIYTCMATNKLGSERREMMYYVTDIPNGFHISLNKVPAEGDDFKLTCSVSKFMYTDITWILFRTVGNRTIHHSISKQRNAIITAHSLILTAIIKNANVSDSGVYACRAKNLYTGKFLLQRKEINITGEHNSKKTVVSRTSKLKRRKRNSTTQSLVTH
ncbi:hypothetical protein XENTR_v10006968 [Xenopus tropicalis]|uniref:Platelet-derived growth factor receptor-like protein n=1 Tax=Xenopus tropicalis TaxID=8364 RepID=F7DSF6_XENTR|nr:vascular endothelial growth factor receptor 1 [Xenopus tropicalis]KAE8627390.1 hypothetical protein XENTR_v10006968 [Xenopus tropicalis]|eukprot:XP_002934078.1 PREDICTED: vascular endothelial growth factor receptor 1 [Xenopus tropicalis]